LIGLKATNCQTGDTLVSAHAEAESLNKVLPALQQAGNELRTNLGESLASVRRFDQPLEEATTSSLDALHRSHKDEGSRSRGRRAAIPHLSVPLNSTPVLPWHTSISASPTPT